MKEPPVSSAKKDLDEKFRPGTAEQGRDETDSAAAPAAQQDSAAAPEQDTQESSEKNDDISRLLMKKDDSSDVNNRTKETLSPANKMEVDEGKTLNKNVKKVQEKDRAKVSGSFIAYIFECILFVESVCQIGTLRCLLLHMVFQSVGPILVLLFSNHYLHSRSLI
jgi:hypothetical protein